MKLCIFGAGAVGSILAVKLARAGEEVSAIARGERLAAIRAKGLTLIEADGTRLEARPRTSDAPAELGPQDLVFVTVKAPSLPELARRIGPLLAPATPVVFAMNGIPWWYFHKSGGPFDGTELPLLDPGGRLWRAVGPERAIGCVVNAPAFVPEPGVVAARNPVCEFVLGEPDGSRSERVLAIAAMLEKAGLAAPVSTEIRRDVWNKLFGNMVMGPISALTRATAGEMAADKALMAVARRAMEEGERVANALGLKFAIDFEKRIAVGGGHPDHKQSTLQDLERGRPMEIDALLTVVVDLGRKLEVETPTLDSILALIRQLARVRGLYPA